MLEYIGRMFSYPFMQRAFLVGILVSLCASLLGGEPGSEALFHDRGRTFPCGLRGFGGGFGAAYGSAGGRRSGGGTCGFYPAASE